MTFTSSFSVSNRQKWAQQVIKTSLSLKSQTWFDTKDIVKVLSAFSDKNLGHILFPGGGGLDLVGVKTSHNPRHIELIPTDKIMYLVRPIKLTLQIFPELLSESYFWLETAKVDVGIDETEVVEIRPGNFISREGWDNDSQGEDEHGNRIPLPSSARLTILNGGTHLLTAKASLYNSIPGTYSGIHAEMKESDFVKQMQILVTKGLENGHHD